MTRRSHQVRFPLPAVANKNHGAIRAWCNRLQRLDHVNGWVGDAKKLLGTLVQRASLRIIAEVDRSALQLCAAKLRPQL
jgi:hypothetical protein